MRVTAEQSRFLAEHTDFFERVARAGPGFASSPMPLLEAQSMRRSFYRFRDAVGLFSRGHTDTRLHRGRGAGRHESAATPEERSYAFALHSRLLSLMATFEPSPCGTGEPLTIVRFILDPIVREARKFDPTYDHTYELAARQIDPMTHHLTVDPDLVGMPLADYPQTDADRELAEARWRASHKGKATPVDPLGDGSMRGPDEPPPRDILADIREHDERERVARQAELARQAGLQQRNS